jgi:hypothetical protein
VIPATLLQMTETPRYRVVAGRAVVPEIAFRRAALRRIGPDRGTLRSVGSVSRTAAQCGAAPIIGTKLGATVMAFDTRAYAKRLKKAGIKRKQARAHAEAMNRYLHPEIATTSDLATLEQSTTANLLALEQRIDRRLTWLEQRQEMPVPHMQLQVLGIMAATLGILIALQKLTENGRGQRPEQKRIASADRFPTG